MQEAMREDVPVLERLKFLGIYSNNLDEFFRVRVATQNRITEYTHKVAKKEKEMAEKLIKEINKINSKNTKEYYAAIEKVQEDLAKENIFIIDETKLNQEQELFIRSFYSDKLRGYVYPVWFSAIKSIVSENDENIYMAVKMYNANTKAPKYAIIELPVAAQGRFLTLPSAQGTSSLIYLDDVVRFCLPFIFSGLGYTHFEAHCFKFTKDAEMEIDDDPKTSMLQKITKGIKSRKRGDAMRVVYDAAMPKDMLRRLIKILNLETLSTMIAGAKYHNHKDFFSFPNCNRADLLFPKWAPVAKRELMGQNALIDVIKRKDQYIHVPYHSFDAYIRLLQQAAISSQVHSIHTTLYRLAKDSKVVKALINAARNGKKVTVIIELLARFDEASNIDWSRKMQEAGVKVIYGVKGLKIHSKITHITMKTGVNIACVSTGNFHEGNAKSYTDYMIMTANRNIVKDVMAVFEFIEKPFLPLKLKELLVSPNEMRAKFIALINQEIKNKLAGKEAYIKIKINHITDQHLIKKLYEASSCGVKIELVVRGNCSIVPGARALSENIEIRGIIDRYLEHSRIFIFANGGQAKVFMGSADWMTRNLDSRIEVITPVYDAQIKQDLIQVVDFALKDNSQARIVEAKGENKIYDNGQSEKFRSQEKLYEYYLKENV